MPATQDPQLVMARLLVQADRLYSLPAVAMQVLEFARNPQIDTRALKDCIENDPALVGKILRVVNSSLFGLGSQVSDLNQALTLLGTKPLKLLVLGFSLPPALFSGVSADVLGRYWRHTLTRAVVARELHERLFDSPGDEAFIAGLLRDLGILLLIQEVGEPYTRLLERVSTAGGDLAEREIEAMGFDHRKLSAGLLAHWGLPESLVHAVDHRGEPESFESTGQPAETVDAAEWFARLLADGDREALGQVFETPAGRLLCGLRRNDLMELVEDFEAKVFQLADILSLTLPAGRDYRDVLVEAHDSLAATASEAADDLLDRREPRHHQGSEPALAVVVESLAGAVAAAPLDSNDRFEREDDPTTADVAMATVARPTSSARVQTFETTTTSGNAGLLDRLSIAAAACRQCRRPLSLLLVQFDWTDELKGTDRNRPRLPEVETLCGNLDYPGTACLPFGEAGLALILPGCDRDEAVRLGHRLANSRAPQSPGEGRQSATSISVGVATVAMPPKNFAHENLLTAADRCLFGARAFGGGVAKSIEIY